VEKHGRKLRDYIVLSLRDMTPNLTQVELGKTLELDKTTLMSQLDRLEPMGLVVRCSDPRDERARIPEKYEGRKHRAPQSAGRAHRLRQRSWIALARSRRNSSSGCSSTSSETARTPAHARDWAACSPTARSTNETRGAADHEHLGVLEAIGPVRALTRVGRWATGTSNSSDFAVSRVCRHQLGDLSKGTVDADGCLVCPWHQARYDVTDGRMVSRPRGFLGYHGLTPASPCSSGPTPKSCTCG